MQVGKPIFANNEEFSIYCITVIYHIQEKIQHDMRVNFSISLTVLLTSMNNRKKQHRCYQQK